MSASAPPTCDFDAELLAKIKEFRFRKSDASAALLMKIDLASMTILLDEVIEGVSIEELAAELPETQPRFVLFTFKHTHKDGRTSFPIIFVYYSPDTVKPETHMLYASAKINVVRTCQVGKEFDVRGADELTQEWLNEKIAFFK